MARCWIQGCGQALTLKRTRAGNFHIGQSSVFFYVYLTVLLKAGASIFMLACNRICTPSFMMLS